MAMEDQGVDKMALFGVPTVGAWGLDPAVADAMVRGFFPHPEGPYPDGVRHFVDRNGIDAEAKRKILCDNGQRLYGVT